MTMDRVSDFANGDSVTFWEGAREGKLLFQQCRACRAVQFPPRYHCAKCWDSDLEWIESSGTGTVESFTVVHRAPAPAFREQVPYVVASVVVAEGPRMITNIIGNDALDIDIGDNVRVVFPEDDSGNVLPRFERVQ